MKNRVTIILIIIIVILCGLLGLSFLKISKLENKEKIVIEEKEEKYSTEDNILIDENTKTKKLSAEATEVFTTLSTYASDFMDNDKYKSLEKKNDVYFVSLNELNNKYGYDISMFKDIEGNVCDINKSGIYFDNEHKMNTLSAEDENIIIPLLMGCFTGE